MADPVARYRAGNLLLTLVERAGLAAGRLLTAPPEARGAARSEAVAEQARLSAILDGSPLEPETADRVGRGIGEGHGPPHGAAGAGADSGTGPTSGWSAALRVDGLPTQEVAAREYANLLACAEVESEVLATFFDQPLQAITRLHSAICDGLVERDKVARLRRTDRAIHDGAQGQMLWAAPAPDRIAGLMDALLEWLGTQSADSPTLAVAAIAHERILEWQPFEAANGRLARSVARVIRRARGLDPDGLAVPERYWRRYALDYHREVAATMRRRGDLTRWIERIAHAETVALETAADAIAVVPAAAVPEDLADLIAALGDGATITIKEAAGHLGISRERARATLLMARNAGFLEDDLSVAAPRFRVVAPRLGP